jgi:FAD synthetase
MHGFLFGCFDLFHPGHHYFISKALEIDNLERLTIVVTRDSIMFQLKNKNPIDSEQTRIDNIRKNFPTVNVILGDEKLGSYNVIKQHKPQIIIFGYDQDKFSQHLLKSFPTMKTVTIDSFEPEYWSSTKIRERIS